MRDIGRRDFHAERVAEAGILVPIANMRSGHPVGTAEAIEKARQPALGIGNRSAAAGAFGEGDGARAVTCSRIAFNRSAISSSASSQLDPLPTRIADRLLAGCA